MKPVTLHLLQHLKPGGIESLALEFQRAAQPLFDVHIISLEKHNVKCYWNNIDGFEEFIHVLNKKPGWQMNIFSQLTAFFKKVKPIYVHTHHIGPLIYGGVAKANFDNIVFSDVSALLPVNSLLMLDSHFKNPKVGAVSGGYKFIQKGTAGEQCYWKYQSMVKTRESSIASVLGAHGAFYALRKSCYDDVPAETINDDFLIPMNVIKQGYRVIYEPRVVAIELEQVNLEQDMGRRLRIAAGNFQQLVYLLPLLSPKYGWNAINFASGKALRAIMPFILVFIFIGNIYLAPIHTLFISLLACQLFLYGLVMLINVFQLSPKLRALKLICYLVNGYWVALKGSLKYIFGLQEKIWTKI